jgi:hypothetical protein
VPDHVSPLVVSCPCWYCVLRFQPTHNTTAMPYQYCIYRVGWCSCNIFSLVSRAVHVARPFWPSVGSAGYLCRRSRLHPYIPRIRFSINPRKIEVSSLLISRIFLLFLVGKYLRVCHGVYIDLVSAVAAECTLYGAWNHWVKENSQVAWDDDLLNGGYEALSLLCLELENPPPLEVIAAAERGARNDVSGEVLELRPDIQLAPAVGANRLRPSPRSTRKTPAAYSARSHTHH